MKRMSLLTLLLVLGAGLLMYAYADQDSGPRRGYGMGYGMHEGMGPGMGYGMHEGMGPGMGYGMGPGMGYGMGPGMMPFWDKVPEGKRKQMEQLHRSMGPAMMRKMQEAQDMALTLRDIMHNFPIDEKAINAQWKSLNQARDETFQLRLAMMTQTQQILGKELWSEMNKGWVDRR